MFDERKLKRMDVITIFFSGKKTVGSVVQITDMINTTDYLDDPFNTMQVEWKLLWSTLSVKIETTIYLKLWNPQHKYWGEDTEVFSQKEFFKS